MSFYPAAEVDANIEGLLGLLESSLEMQKTAQAELQALRAKAATGPQVILEKVATTTLDPGTLGETLQYLVDHAYLAPENREKMAAELQKDPNAALRLVTRVAQLSSPAHEGGSGVKTASRPTPTVDDGWNKVATEGA